MKFLVKIIAQYSLLGLLVGVFAGCSWLPKQKDETEGWSAARIYTRAKADLDKGNYTDAVKYYEKIETRYPFGTYAQQAQLEIAYAYYKNEDFDQALAACERFMKLHPQHPKVDYAYYLKGLVNYRFKAGLLERMFPIDHTTRDATAARQAFFDFKALVEKFPDSKYARDSRERMLFMRNNLAKHEVVVAQHYYDQGAYVAAVNRAKYVVENYDQSPSIKAALAILYQSYIGLGLNDLASATKRVMAKNYPNHPIVTGKPVRKSILSKVIPGRKKKEEDDK